MEPKRYSKIMVNSPNHNERIRFLVIHFTEISLNDTLMKFQDRNSHVSAHYVVPQNPTDDGDYYQIVDESKRAWHAGVSSWQGRNHVNDTSIGIEFANESVKNEHGEYDYLPFTEHQKHVAVRLCKEIIDRYRIEPTCVVGHSDVAFGRKADPGPLFFWEQLADVGVGAWAYEQDRIQVLEDLRDQSIDIGWVQKSLQDFGYAVSLSGVHDEQSKIALRAFQQHFRQENYNGVADYESALILSALMKKYHPNLYTPLREF